MSNCDLCCALGQGGRAGSLNMVGVLYLIFYLLYFYFLFVDCYSYCLHCVCTGVLGQRGSTYKFDYMCHLYFVDRLVARCCAQTQLGKVGAGNLSTVGVG